MSLLYEINKISQSQETFLSERQQKAKLKAQKDFLNYLTQQCKNNILEHLNDYTRNELIEYIINEYFSKLQQYKYFDKTLRKQKYFEMIDFLDKQLKKMSTKQKAELAEQKQALKEYNKLMYERFQLQLVNFFQDCYNQNGVVAYYKLNQCKNRVLEILKQTDSYKAFNFYDIQNKRLFNEYKKNLKVISKPNGNFFKYALLGTCIRCLQRF